MEWWLLAWKMFTDFASSPAGGFVIGQLSADDFKKEWDRFVDQADENFRGGLALMSNRLGLGTGAIGDPLDPASDNFDPDLYDFNQGLTPDQNASQSAQDKYQVWQQLGDAGFVESTVLGGALETSREVEALGKKHFDPEAATERYGRAFESIAGELEDLPGDVQAASQDVQDLYGGLRSELTTGAADIATGYEDILGMARGLVSQLGESERRDIDRRFTEAGTEAEMRLGSRGIGGTIQASVGAGIERERSDALLDLNEQIAQQRLGVEEAFGLGALSSQERLLGTGLNIGAQQGQAMQFGNQLYAGTATAALGARGNIAAGEVGAYDQAAVNEIMTILESGKFLTDTQLESVRIGLGWQGQQPLFAPTPNYAPNPYQSGGF